MLSRRAELLFYACASPAMRLNGVLYRHFRRPSPESFVRSHLGPGQRKYLPGWINIDANIFTSKRDVWADLRNPLPFPDDSVDAFYSHHMVEHLPDLAGHFRELYRCLKPGGAFRVTGPNGDMAIRKFIDADASWFGEYPDRRTSVGGRLDNFILCRGEHIAILTESYLKELVVSAGFRDPTFPLVARETSHPELFDEVLETEAEEAGPEAFPKTIVAEGVKPS
ncbi:MAG: methyltransferase domain-containing protein [Deltaproteobacteria bacterium]|nr:methyltransferase domain-containing protein [Deltaproteobacteria bacterium]